MSISVLNARRQLAFVDELISRNGWYHSMEFSDGTRIDGYIPSAVLEERYANFGLPADLTGMRTLDIGAWDGWFSFEMERRGAEVTAVDVVPVANFEYARERKRSGVKYVVEDVHLLGRHRLGQFDYTLFLGVLYHVRHPLLALEVVCSLTRRMAIVDSFVIDGEERSHIDSPLPFCEFYETDELGGNLDNWFGPTVECLMAFCRAAGFVRVTLLNIWHRHARVACYRHWEDAPVGGPVSAPVLVAAKHSRDGGVLFSSDREEYVSYWFTCDAERLERDEVLPEVGEFAAPVLVLEKKDAGMYLANARIPPGLGAGAHGVRLRLAGSGFSNEREIFVDSPLRAGEFEIVQIFDGVSGLENRVSYSTGGFLTMWVRGLPAWADLTSTELYAGSQRIPLTYVGPAVEGALRQVNAQLVTVSQVGRLSLYLRHGVGLSNVVEIQCEE